MGPIFKTELVIYQSKDDLDEKILFDKITDHLDLEIRKIPVRGLYGNRIFHVPFWSMISHFIFHIEVHILSFRNRILIQ